MPKTKRSQIEQLAERVVALRKAKGWSGAELSRRTGLSLPTIRRIENAKTWPQMRVALSLAEALEVKLGELLS